MKLALVFLAVALVGCVRRDVESSPTVTKVSVADLANHSDRFAGKRVRVKGRWATRMEDSRLLPPSRDESIPHIWLRLGESIGGRHMIDDAYRDFDYQRNFNTYYFVEIDCEGVFSWDPNRGFGHLRGSKAELIVDRVIRAERLP